MFIFNFKLPKLLLFRISFNNFIKSKDYHVTLVLGQLPLSHQKDLNKEIETQIKEIGISDDAIFTDLNIESMLHFTADKQKTVDVLLNNNIPFNESVVETLIKYAPNKQQIVDYIIGKQPKELSSKIIIHLLENTSDKQSLIEYIVNHISLDNGIINAILAYSKEIKKTLEL